MSTTEDSAEGEPTASATAVSSDPEVDEELSSLLESALNDFDIKRTTATSVVAPGVECGSAASSTANSGSNAETDDTFDDKLSADFEKFDEMFSPLINSDPQLKEHWTRLTKSCAEAANATSDEEFQNSLQETLKTISEKAQSVVGQENNLSEEELAKIWSNLGIGGDEEGEGEGGAGFTNLMPLMTNMMQNLLSKELLYPALSELADKYPQYLNENKDSLSADDMKRYTKQMELMREVCAEFDAECAEDSDSVRKERFQRILAVMQAMQNCGSPPTQLIGDVPDFTTGLPPDLKLPDIPGLNGQPNPGQCSLM